MVRLTDRSYILVEPGEESRDIPDAAIKHYHPDLVRIGAELSKPRAAENKEALVENMTDDELRAFVEKKTGKKPHPNAKRETLVERALA